MYPIEKYKYVIRPARVDADGTEHGPVVIAISHYAGKTVRGVAKCAPNDVFDESYGKQLAAARCDAIIAEKRMKRYAEKTAEAYRKMYETISFCEKMVHGHSDACKEYNDAIIRLHEIEGR